MKIVYVADSTIPSRAANSIHVIRMCSAFSSFTHNVTLLTSDRNDTAEQNVENPFHFYGAKEDFKIKRIWHPYFKGKDIINITLTLGAIVYINPDLVYGRSLHHCYFAARAGYDVIFEVHDIITNGSGIAASYLRYLLKSKKLRKFVVISEALKKKYAVEYDISNVVCQVAHDGADIPTEDAKEIENWPGQVARIQCGYAGHLYKGRGIEIIIELAARFHDIDFHVAGGTDEDLDYWHESTRLSNIYFHGFLSPSLVAAFRRKCDILLAPYQTNLAIFGGGNDTSSFMSPLKIFEYMSSRRAMVVSDFPVLREVLNESNSILVKPDDILEWISALTLLQDSWQRQKIADKAYDDFVNKYTWTNRAKEILADG